MSVAPAAAGCARASISFLLQSGCPRPPRLALEELRVQRHYQRAVDARRGRQTCPPVRGPTHGTAELVAVVLLREGGRGLVLQH
eukprot:1306433-Pyramimonas_sp.AAC.1